MQKNKIYALLCLLIFILIACSREVTLDPPSVPPKIVINCFFTQDSAWQVSLYQSAAASGGSIFNEVKEAQIEIYEDDKFLTTLPVFKTQFAVDKQRIHYYTEAEGTKHAPQCGHQYTIKVKAPGFEAVTASDYLLFPPTVERFVVDSVLATAPNLTQLIIRPEINLRGHYHYDLLKNTSNAINYYGAAFVYEAKIKPTGLYILSTNIPKEDTSFVQRLDVGLGITGLLIDNYVSLFTIYPDTLWKENPHQVASSYFAPLANRLTIPKEIYFEAYTFSPNYQKYGESAVQQLAYQKDPFSEPKPVFSNVQGGYGVFASYATRRIIVPIKK